MNTPNDAGPAFPVPPDAYIGTGDPRDGLACVQANPGMSTRTYIATKALAGYNASPTFCDSDSDKKAQWAVQDADALIAELKLVQQ